MGKREKIIEKEKVLKVEAGQALRKFLIVLKFVIFLVILLGIPTYIFFCHKELLVHFQSLEALNQFLAQYKTTGIFVLIALQVIQIIICIIPGQAMQFAAGYLYGFWIGYLFSIAGAAIGTMITFFLARILGKDALLMIFGAERFNKFIDKLNTKRGFILVFIIYLIPGLPKDLFNYAAGVSDMSFKSFMMLSLVGRSPAMMCSIIIGSMFLKGSYVGIGILCAVVLVCFILGIKHHEKLARKIDECYVKLMKL